MITFGNGSDTRYVNRGDPADYDFTKDDLIADQTWRDLDLSAIVPAGVSEVHLQVRICSIVANAGVFFRKKDNVNQVNMSGIKTQVANLHCYQDARVTCSPDGIIQYLAGPVSWTTIDIVVRGWFEKVGGGLTNGS